MKDTNTPTCKLCLNDVHAAHGNTTTLLSHLKNNHSEQYLEDKPSSKISSQNDKSQIEDCIVRKKFIFTCSSEHKQITNGITRCLAKDMLQISIVDKHGFRDMKQGSHIRLACTLLGWKRISCFGHNLDLADRKGLDDQRIT